MRIELLDSVDSTNRYIARYVPMRENVIVCAKKQTGGMGTKGRSFVSEEGGVYLTALLFYDLPAREAFRVMAHAAVSVCKTAREFGVEATIKWPNDVFAGGKKLCGILVENALSGERIDHSVVGIGVNVTNGLSAVSDVATSFRQLLSAPPTAEEVRDCLIRNLLQKTAFEEYMSFVGFLGRRVRIEEGGRTYFAVPQKVLPDGRLVVKTEEGETALSSAEMKL